jgi:hypothetical protein
MPVCGLFQVLRALEIRGNFTGAAMHTPLPRRVRHDGADDGPLLLQLQASCCVAVNRRCGPRVSD